MKRRSSQWAYFCLERAPMLPGVRRQIKVWILPVGLLVCGGERHPYRRATVTTASPAVTTKGLLRVVASIDVTGSLRLRADAKHTLGRNRRPRPDAFALRSTSALAMHRIDLPQGDPD